MPNQHHSYSLKGTKLNLKSLQTVFAILISGTLVGCSSTPIRCSANSKSDVHQAHDNFVNAINSNELDQFLSMITEDIVFMAPNSPRLEGKEQVKPWGAGYYDAFHTTWTKTSLELVVIGEWAFEQYSYESEDTEKATGLVYRDTGKGIIIYHHDSDGVWRVARDAWNSDLPIIGE
tara:strand:- start:120596 stop:121123 length:528 start_codon:yes stop_codon:yes gene_type:complete